jgi:hypothetical protein
MAKKKGKAQPDKLFIVKKYVKARSAADASGKSGASRLTTYG